MFYTCTGAGRVSRRALPDRAEPGQGDGLQLVAQPVHGLRPPLHVLLRARLRAARRPAVRRPLRPLDPREDQRRRGAAHASSRARRGSGDRRDRRGDRPVPARRGPLPADARLPRGARDAAQPVQPDHAQPDDRARPRRAREAATRARGRRRLLGARRSTTRSGARPSPGTAPPRQRLEALRQLVDAGVEGGRRDGADPARDLRPPGAARGRRARRARGRRDRASGRTSSTSSPARASTSSTRSRATGRRSSSATSASTDRARTSRRRRWSRSAGSSPSSAASTESATAGRCGCEPAPGSS